MFVVCLMNSNNFCFLVHFESEPAQSPRRLTRLLDHLRYLALQAGVPHDQLLSRS